VRRGLREVTIFGLSLLDVLSSALGAVLIVLLIFHNISSKTISAQQNEISSQQNEISSQQNKISSQQNEIKDITDENTTLKRKLKKILFGGIRTDQNRLVILVDLSGSIKNSGADILSLVRDTIIRLVEIIPDKDPIYETEEEYYFNLVGFHEMETFVPCFSRYRLVSATPENRAKARICASDFIDRAEGGTPTRQALEEVLGYDNVEAIILLTDGAPNDCQQPGENKIACLLRVQRQITRNNTAGVEIHTIGLGNELYKEEGKFRHFLKELAKENRGTFVAL